MGDTPIAELISDCHWSHSPPLIRSKEGSWYDTQKNYMEQIEAFRPTMMSPIIAAGDVFHKCGASPYIEPAEFINFILEHMPEMYAVPGQHDLPNHRYDDIHKSIFWTMVKARRIIPIEPGKPLPLQIRGQYKLVLHGFPYGYEITPCPKHKKGEIHLAVVHSYIWMKDYKYEGAPTKYRVKRYLKKLKGYDAAVFGDNHKTILYNGDNIVIINPGTVMRRRADEIEHKPCVGILYDSGRIEKKYLNVTGDRLLEGDRLKKLAAVIDIDMDDFIKEVDSLVERGIDLGQATREYCDRFEVKRSVRKLLLKSLCLLKKKKFGGI